MANLAFHNIEQFLRLGGELYEESLGAALIRQNPVLSPERQQHVLFNACETRLQDLPRRAGRDVARFLEAVGQYCQYETYRPNAPYAPGVTGIAISMADRERLAESSYRTENSPYRRFAEMLASALSQNIFRAELDRRVKGGHYMVLYLNRIACLRYRLPMGYGGLSGEAPHRVPGLARPRLRKAEGDYLCECHNSASLGGLLPPRPSRFRSLLARVHDRERQGPAIHPRARLRRAHVSGRRADRVGRAAPGSGTRFLIEYDEGTGTSSGRYAPLRDQNGHKLARLLTGRGTVDRRQVQMVSDDGRRIGARSINNEFQSLAPFLPYTDVLGRYQRTAARTVLSSCRQVACALRRGRRRGALTQPSRGRGTFSHPRSADRCRRARGERFLPPWIPGCEFRAGGHEGPTTDLDSYTG